MNKLSTLAITAIAAIMMSSFTANAADQAKVTFKGNIYKATCSLSASDAEVLMGSWAAKSLKKGDVDANTKNTTTAKNFSLIVGECDAGDLTEDEQAAAVTASLNTSGRVIPNGNDVIFNDNADGKANAGVVMYYLDSAAGNKETVVTNKEALGVAVPLATATSTVIPFTAYIGSVVDTPNPQAIISAVTFSLGYN